MFRQQWNPFGDDSPGRALVKEDFLILLGPESRGCVWEDVDVGGDPLGSPHEIVSDLNPDFVPGPAICEQVVRDLVVSLSQDLFVLPSVSQDVARNHVANRFEIAYVEVDKLLRGRTTPELIRREIEDGEAGKTPVPARTGRVHGNDNIVVVLQEGHAIPEAEGGMPPPKIRETGGVDQNWTVDRRGQSFRGENSVGEQPPGIDDIGSVKETANH